MKTEQKSRKTSEVRSRMSAKRKQHVATILDQLGMNHSEAINLFYAQIELLKGLPFDVRIPNEATASVLKDSKAGKNIKHFSSKEAMFKDLGL